VSGTGRKALTAASIFGLCDGLMSILGVIFTLRAHPALVPWSAAIGGIGAGLSMAVGQYVSTDNDDGAPACLTLGLATSVGSVLPALPYLALHGAAAIWSTGAICFVLVCVVAVLRTGGRARRGVLVFGLLSGVFGVTLGCALAAPAGA
jgi:VIT1/CCC1 family predicted Fe2+/Mn2+ transporter